MIKVMLKFPWEPRRFVLRWTETYNYNGEEVDINAKLEIRKPKGHQDYAFFLYQDSKLLFGERLPVKVWQSRIFSFKESPFEGLKLSEDLQKKFAELTDACEKVLQAEGIAGLLSNNSFHWRVEKY